MSNYFDSSVLFLHLKIDFIFLFSQQRAGIIKLGHKLDDPLIIHRVGLVDSFGLLKSADGLPIIVIFLQVECAQSMQCKSYKNVLFAQSHAPYSKRLRIELACFGETGLAFVRGSDRVESYGNLRMEQ